jgi:hypothetical protein
MIKTYLVLIAVIILFTACNTEKTNNNINGYFPMSKIGQLDSLGRPIDKKAFYFPVYEFEAFKTSQNKIPMDTVVTMATSNILYSLEEPILSSKYSGFEMYRILYYGQTGTKSVRIVKKNDKTCIIVKKGEMEGPFPPCKLIGTEFFNISTVYWDSLTTLANKSRMWNPPASKKDNVVSPSYFFEGHKEEGYTHLGFSRIENDVNLKEVERLLHFFERIEKMNPNKK